MTLSGVTVMNEKMADQIRRFVERGGIAVMTSQSAMVQENGQVFATTRPGLLSDLFGIHLGGFEETSVFNELSRMHLEGKQMEITYRDQSLRTEAERWDVIQPRTAQVLGHIVSLDKDYPIITSNRYGKGLAVYIGLPARVEILNPIVDELESSLALRNAPDVPDGVLARRIDAHHYLFLNTNQEPQTIDCLDRSKSLLSGKQYGHQWVLAPNEPEFVAVP